MDRSNDEHVVRTAAATQIRLTPHRDCPEDTRQLNHPRTHSEPLPAFDQQDFDLHYSHGVSQSEPVSIPTKPAGFNQAYLCPSLASDERLRLCTLWYHVRGLHEDLTAMQRIQEKVKLVKSLIGWEYAICGILDCDALDRIAAVGLPLTLVPRGESPCSHTILQPEHSVLFLPDMRQDWRFKDSPQVSKSGLRSYAGTQLLCQTQSGQHVAIGSLCVASETPTDDMAPANLELLTQFANMLVADIVYATTQRRLEQQKRNDRLLSQAIARLPAHLDAEAILSMVKEAFDDDIEISLTPINHGRLQLSSAGPAIPHDVQRPCRLWEDDEYIEDFIKLHNHEKSRSAKHPIRAIISSVQDDLSGSALVVSTRNIAHVFDDIDIRFVTSCTLLLNSVAKERSLQRAIEAKDRFMRGVTHHLRTPLHGILACTELLGDDLARPSQSNVRDLHVHRGSASENLAMIRDSGRELARVVNSIIRYNYWAVSNDEVRPPVLITLDALETQIVQEIPSAVLAAYVARTCIFFDRMLPDHICLATHDELLVKDCIQPLVLNALQNTARGSVVITYSATPDFSAIVFDVRDTGRGIPPEHHERIFDHYENVDGYEHKSGLGLTLSRKAAESSNGTVTLEASEHGLGSHFRAILPIGFACTRPDAKAASVSSGLAALPKQYYVVQSSVPDEMEKSLARHLESHGLTRSNSLESAVAIIPFSHDLEEYKMRLNQAEGAACAFSLVPNQADISLLLTAYPSIQFFHCPFTSSRLNEILSSMDMACKDDESLNHDGDCQELQKDESTTITVQEITLQRKDSSVTQLGPVCLIVDDNLINLRILGMFCEQRRYAYSTAVDGFEAIDQYQAAAKALPISLVLLDLQMPKCSGIEACTAIRAYEASNDMSPAVILIITGQDTPGDREAVQRAGADHYFVKPLSMKKLDEAIASYFTDLA